MPAIPMNRREFVLTSAAAALLPKEALAVEKPLNIVLVF